MVLKYFEKISSHQHHTKQHNVPDFSTGTRISIRELFKVEYSGIKTNLEFTLKFFSETICLAFNFKLLFQCFGR